MRFKVYLVRHGDSDFYKIGVARNIKERIADLQVASPVELHLVHTINAGDATSTKRRAEGLLHKAYTPKNAVRGEWFRFDVNEVKVVIDHMNHLERMIIQNMKKVLEILDG